ncbi:Udp-glucose 6-dehydrogenase [Venustampulla echinocandica]|uniref:UDP-glucose 6-dehydrogenase n=1 Tax=Venustampulla echinocandica TaxID=2656787 RepID=A0A370TWM1_9HELO|nr:Udp-glucose 6-dehydrogenase [Venustampulla echinocandica]RDL39925.1 Udp-glucose 6-dehydrogenase [Venustampulla echinocandica]
MASAHLPSAASTVDTDDCLVDASTAPTTPDGSLTFSPVLEALKLRDALEGATAGRGTSIQDTSLDGAMYPSRCEIRNVCCVGAGYVGGPTAAMIALQNPHLRVTVVDRDPSRIRQWKSKHLPIHEPGLQHIIRITRDGSKALSFFNEPARFDSFDSVSSASSATSECESQCGELRDEIYISSRSPNLFFSTEVSKTLSQADIVFIAVNTPTKKRGMGAGRATDMTALEAVSREIAIHAKPGAIIVEKSTVPCRTAEMIQNTFKAHRPNINFEILSNPEFLAEGSAMTDLLYPDRVIIGCSPTPSGHHAAASLASIYASWVPRPKIITMNTWSSELSKLAANAMLAQRISSINSISAICEATGADIDEIAQSIGLDPRIGDKFLKAGVGFGGSCFKKDILSLTYLAEGLGLPEVAEYWTQVLNVNDWQRSRFARKVVRCMNGTLVGKKLSILGYAFKKNTSDTRESPALECIKILLEDAPGEIAIFDPCCEPAKIKEEIKRWIGSAALRELGGPIEVYNDAYQACSNSHAVVIMTECDEFRNYPSSKSPKLFPSRKTERPIVVDPRPFARLEPTESELLALHGYLSPALDIKDPLLRFEEEPACDDSCAMCAEKKGKLESVRSGKENQNERLDWVRIAYHLQRPKWVFDGRGVLDIAEMEKLGVRVEAIGKVGWGGR